MDETIRLTEELSENQAMEPEAISEESKLASEAEAGEASQPQMVTVVDIYFRENAKNYFFDPGTLTVRPEDHVIIDTARGVEFGYCAVGNHQVPATEIVAPLRKVLRLATAQDERVNSDNQEREKRAFEVCKQKILDRKLEMQLVSCECAFDGSKLLFFFTADGRVDFRELVKDLASVFRTRIELRQIGVRDKAKLVGGLGVCGRPFCCKQFLDDFQPVSIKMAKTQSLSLNPTKISGVCGRLMCCLKYEQDAYEDLLRTAPKNESFVDTPDGRGTVTEVNLLRQSVKVRMEDHPETISCFKNCDICVLRSGKARKNDPPIPRDLAPISSAPRKKPAEAESDPFRDQLPDIIFSDAVSVIQPLPEEPQKEVTESAAAAAPTDEHKPAHRRRRGARGGHKPAAEGETRQQSPKEPREPKENREKAPNSRKEHREKAPNAPKESSPAKAANPEGAPASGEQKPHTRRRRYRGRKGGGSAAPSGKSEG